MAKTKSNTGLQMLMTAASLVGFLGGWALLGHAPKPGTIPQSVQLAVSTGSNGTLLQLPAQSLGKSQTAGLRLRTGGS
jgi:hypothetical protein